MPDRLQTCAFLFTDIEGSTRLWERFPEAMRVALREHDVRLRAVFAAHRGNVFKTIGDAFCVAFPEAPDALAAALAAQQSLNGLFVVEDSPVRVRMSAHLGLVERRDDDYFGPTLNRTARQLSVAYGGQVLVSDALRILAEAALPEGASLRALGEHRLKDLERPEPIHQLCHPDLPPNFPPLRSLTTVPNNLPTQLSPFVGREKAVAEVASLLAKSRLVTLTGSGGIGKTRLAFQVAADVLAGLPDGAFFLDFATLSDPNLIPQVLVETLGLSERPGQTEEEHLVEYLCPRTLLLLWDNAEHLLERSGELISYLLENCPTLRILATSREPLGVSGERVWRVPPFPPSEAVSFFLDRVAQHQNGYVPTPEAAASIARICRRLDGIPLALELAAARVRALAPQQIEARLSDAFRLLSGTHRGVLPRQQTVRALIDWSYDLLDESEKRLLRALGVFVGGWTLEAVEAICGDDAEGETDVLDLLTALVEKSLVVAEEDGGAYRYRLLEVLRQYCLERSHAEDAPERVEARRRAHQRWYGELARAAEAALQTSEQVCWVKTLESEHDNLRQAQEVGGDEGAWIAVALVAFWRLRGYFSEGRLRLDRALAQLSDSDSLLRTKLLAGAAQLASQQGDYPRASALQEESLALARAQGDRVQAGRALVQLGLLAVSQGYFERAQSLYDEGLQLFRDADEPGGIAWAQNIVGILFRSQGRVEEARERFLQSLSLQRRLGKPQNIAACLNNLGLLALDREAYDEARALYGEVLQINRELGSRWSIASTLHNLGLIARRERRLTEARHDLGEALALARELGDPQLVTQALIELAGTALDEGETESATSFLVEASGLVRQHTLKLLATEVMQLWARLHIDGDRPERGKRFLQTAEALRTELGASRSPLVQAEYAGLYAALEGIAPRPADDWRTLLLEEESAFLPYAAGMSVG